MFCICIDRFLTARENFCHSNYIGKSLNKCDSACEELSRQGRVTWKERTKPTIRTGVLSGFRYVKDPAKGAELWEQSVVLVFEGKKSYKDITMSEAEAFGIRECMNNQYLAEERMR